MAPRPRNPGGGGDNPPHPRRGEGEGEGGSGGNPRRRQHGGGKVSHVSETQVEAGRTLGAGRSGGSGGGGGGSRPVDRRTVPHGFDSFQEFQAFAGPLRQRMREQYPDLEMGFQGSSVTGRSADTGAPFDAGRTSDFDVAISGDSLYQAARARGVEFRGDGVSTGPLSDADLRALGLDGIVSDARAQAGGRPINLMIYRTMEDATGRKPTIRVWF